ncbi:hypothetical protein LCGC14_0686740 [marine sediment metagenome]|uniref:HNH endonuclease 5 domain-containing protein n=1 Tax=marine sediment metagenome TaxID=412755 RepID=A0A0F9R704_9ZZZZ
MNKTRIEWALNPDGSPGYSWNPITGCLNGCDYCYARRLANTRLKDRYLANKNIANADIPFYEYKDGPKIKHLDPFYPRSWFDRREPALEGKKPKGIFVCSMSDLFGIGVPEDWTRHVLTLIRLSPQHRFYLLTKQPQNLIKFSPFPDNAWVGVSATDRASYNNAVWYLKDIKAKVRYLSFEPLLGQTVAGILDNRSGYDWPVMHGSILQNTIDWVIIGAQTKPTIMPKIEWVREIVEACDKAGVKVFLKDSLIPLLEPHGTEAHFFNYTMNTLRQEIPRSGKEEKTFVSPEELDLEVAELALKYGEPQLDESIGDGGIRRDTELMKKTIKSSNSTLNRSSDKGKEEIKKRRELKDYYILRYGDVCMTCNNKNRDWRGISLSHIIPLSRGGKTTKENTLNECYPCHDHFEKRPELRIKEAQNG